MVDININTDDEKIYNIPVTEEMLKKLYGGNDTLKGRNLADDNYLQKNWRPAMAILYLCLCLLDYGVRPIVNQYYAKNFDLVQTVEAIKDLPPSTQVKALDIASRNELWPPIINEFVHIAFGALLTAAAGTRGLEKIQRLKTLKRKS